MDRSEFLKLADVSKMDDEEQILLYANKILDTDLTDVANAARAVNTFLGKGDVGGRIGNGIDDMSTATFGEFTAEAKTYPAAIVRLIVKAVEAKSLDKFLAEPKANKSKERRDGLGSPAGASARTNAAAGRNY